jgi:hypothetical protein
VNNNFDDGSGRSEEDGAGRTAGADHAWGGGLCTIVQSWQWTAGPWRLQWVGGDRWARVLG